MKKWRIRIFFLTPRITPLQVFIPIRPGRTIGIDGWFGSIAEAMRFIEQRERDKQKFA